MKASGSVPSALSPYPYRDVRPLSRIAREAVCRYHAGHLQTITVRINVLRRVEGGLHCFRLHRVCVCPLIDVVGECITVVPLELSP